MGGDVAKKKSPEEAEIEAKQAELAAIEEEMSSLQLEFTTLESQLQAFSSQYLQRFGGKFLYLDELKAKIAAADATMSSGGTEEISEGQEVAEPLEDGEGAGRKLVRLIRMISSARDRMQLMRSDIEAMQAGDAAALYREYQDQGERLFEAIERNLDAEIRALEGSLPSFEEEVLG